MITAPLPQASPQGLGRLLASERSERDTLRSVQPRIAIFYSTNVTFAL